jgi:cytochrome c oxidase assembly factor CtaG
MILLGAVLAAVFAYLAAGVLVARRHLPVMWARARAEWSPVDQYVWSSVRWRMILAAAGWPAALAAWWITPRFDRLIEQGDPVTLARQVAERDQRIVSLERELDIGQGQP